MNSAAHAANSISPTRSAPARSKEAAIASSIFSKATPSYRCWLRSALVAYAAACVFGANGIAAPVFTSASVGSTTVPAWAALASSVSASDHLPGRRTAPARAIRGTPARRACRWTAKENESPPAGSVTTAAARPQKRRDRNRKRSNLQSEFCGCRRAPRAPTATAADRERRGFADLVCPRMYRAERQRHEHRQEDDAARQERPGPAVIVHATRLGHLILARDA